MRRRAYIRLLVGGSVVGVAGCSEVLDDESETEGSDDDEPEPGPSEPTHTTEEIGGPNDLDESARDITISVDEEPFADPEVGFHREISNFQSYSFDQVNVTVRPEGAFFEHLVDDEEHTVQVFARKYPDGAIVGAGHSELFQPEEIDSTDEWTIPIDYRTNVVGEEVAFVGHLSQQIIGEDELDIGSETIASQAMIGATDPFTVTKSGIQSYQSEYERVSDTISYQELTTSENHPEEGLYTVNNVEGGYFVYFETSTPRGYPTILFRIPFYIPKRTYGRWKSKDRPSTPERIPDRISYVTEAIEEGMGTQLANVLEEIANLQGYTSDEEKIEYFSTFVQSLPYALDDISTGFRDYSRYPAETLVDARGDCVDTTILLAVALLESSVSCDVAYLGYSPDAVSASDAGHLAVGISPDNVTYHGAPYIRSRAQQYYYIEPTAFGKPGEVPKMIDFEKTDLYRLEQ